jgi:hypothetical protein
MSCYPLTVADPFNRIVSVVSVFIICMVSMVVADVKTKCFKWMPACRSGCLLTAI